MHDNKIPLSWAVRKFSQSAAEANARLCSDYAAAAEQLVKQHEDGMVSKTAFLSPPLAITSMKISFSAYVSREDVAQGGDIMLEFDKPANFHSEIKLKPIGSGQGNWCSDFDTGHPCDDNPDGIDSGEGGRETAGYLEQDVETADGFGFGFDFHD